jgi:hypothetical protein
MMSEGDIQTYSKQSHAPIIFEVQCFLLRSGKGGQYVDKSISYLMPVEARERLRRATQSCYWSQVAAGFPILSAPAPFALICFDAAAHRYQRFEVARQTPGLGRAQFGFYPFRVEDAPDPTGSGSAAAIGLVDFMTIDALQRAQDLLPDFASIDMSMLDPNTHYLIFL